MDNRGHFNRYVVARNGVFLYTWRVHSYFADTCDHFCLSSNYSRKQTALNAVCLNA